MITSLKRIIKAGWTAFLRNSSLGIAEIIIITMVIFLVTSLFAFNKAVNILIGSVQEKVDISVYFKKDVLPETIFAVKSDLLKVPEVKEAEYVSREDALAAFKERHKDEPIIIESLNELGDNPFLSSLNITANQSWQYESIQRFLESPSYKEIIDKIDYFQRKPVIDRIYSTTNSLNSGFIIFGILLVLASILTALNTIRISIYHLKDEISTMRLVGASNWFIRGPFLVQGIIAGIIAFLIAFSATFIFTFLVDGRVRMIASEIKPMSLFWSSIILLPFLQLITGLGIGIVASVIGMKRYLNV